MSLLGTPVYANDSTPLWASVGSPTFAGQVTASSFAATGNLRALDASGNTALLLTSGGGNPALGLSYIQSAGTIKFGQIGTGNTNSSLTVSAYGSGADVLTIGGQIVGGGITPTSSTVGGVTVPNGSPQTLTITPAINLVSGGIYDIQVEGYWATGATCSPATGDVATLTLSTGTATSPAVLAYTYEDNQYPAFAEAKWAINTYHPIKIRARLPCNNTQALSLSASFTATGSYTGNALGIAVTNLNIVRVA